MWGRLWSFFFIWQTSCQCQKNEQLINFLKKIIANSLVSLRQALRQAQLALRASFCGKKRFLGTNQDLNLPNRVAIQTGQYIYDFQAFFYYKKPETAFVFVFSAHIFPAKC